MSVLLANAQRLFLSQYIWDDIDAILQQETINLDEFCEAANAVRLHSSLGLGSAHCGSSLFPHFRRVEQSALHTC